MLPILSDVSCTHVPCTVLPGGAFARCARRSALCPEWRTGRSAEPILPVYTEVGWGRIYRRSANNLKSVSAFMILVSALSASIFGCRHGGKIGVQFATLRDFEKSGGNVKVTLSDLRELFGPPDETITVAEFDHSRADAATESLWGTLDSNCSSIVTYTYYVNGTVPVIDKVLVIDYVGIGKSDQVLALSRTFK